MQLLFLVGKYVFAAMAVQLVCFFLIKQKWIRWLPTALIALMCLTCVLIDKNIIDVPITTSWSGSGGFFSIPDYILLYWLGTVMTGGALCAWPIFCGIRKWWRKREIRKNTSG